MEERGIKLSMLHRRREEELRGMSETIMLRRWEQAGWVPEGESEACKEGPEESPAGEPDSSEHAQGAADYSL
eukprot:470986-Hanusia_phi.AAC.1